MAVSCHTRINDDLQARVDEYATVEVKSPLIDALSDKDRQVLNLLREAGKVMDGLFWKQTFGDKGEMDVIDDKVSMIRTSSASTPSSEEMKMGS